MAPEELEQRAQAISDLLYIMEATPEETAESIVALVEAERKQAKIEALVNEKNYWEKWYDLYCKTEYWEEKERLIRLIQELKSETKKDDLALVSKS